MYESNLVKIRYDINISHKPQIYLCINAQEFLFLLAAQFSSESLPKISRLSTAKTQVNFEASMWPHTMG